MNKNVKTSKVFEMVRKRPERIIVLEGSTRSTKTYSLIQYWITLALENENNAKETLRFLALRQRATWIKHSLMADFKDIMKKQFGIWNEDNFNKKDSVYVLGNSEFIFGGLDHEGGQRFHGMPTDYVWFNEANEIDWPSVDQILLRMKKKAFFDYNPNINAQHWLLKRIKPRSDCVVIHSTYKDNPFLEDKVVAEIESREPTEANIKNGTADATIWKIYGLGLRAEIKGLIFPNVKAIKELPKCENYGFGMDFGFATDPSTLVQCFELNGELYLKERMYKHGLLDIVNPHDVTHPSVEQEFIDLKIPKVKKIWADSADPQAIKNLCICGWDMEGAKKPAGSILSGINLMKRYNLNVTEDSMNLLDELSKYKWKEDRNGTSLGEPIGTFNHIIDAARYYFYMSIGDARVRLGGGSGCGIESVRMHTGADRFEY